MYAFDASPCISDGRLKHISSDMPVCVKNFRHVLCCINSRPSLELQIAGAEMAKTPKSGIPDCLTRRTAYSDELHESYWSAYAVFWSFKNLDKDWFAWPKIWWELGKKKTWQGIAGRTGNKTGLVENPSSTVAHYPVDRTPPNNARFWGSRLRGWDDEIVMSDRFRHSFCRFVEVRRHNANFPSCGDT